MAKETVLAIGIEPGFADFAAFPQFTPELVRSYVDAQIERLGQFGFEADSCLTDLGETAEAVATAALRSKRYDCVVIGAGLRQPAPQLLLFEKIINRRQNLLQHHAGRHRRGGAALGQALIRRICRLLQSP